MKMLSMNARPVITVLGGTCCVPMAFRKIDSTTEILMKDYDSLVLQSPEAVARVLA